MQFFSFSHTFLYQTETRNTQKALNDVKNFQLNKLKQKFRSTLYRITYVLLQQIVVIVWIEYYKLKLRNKKVAELWYFSLESLKSTLTLSPIYLIVNELKKKTRFITDNVCQFYMIINFMFYSVVVIRNARV